MTTIFKSLFTLKFKSIKIQESYDYNRNIIMRKCNIIFSIINLVISILYCLVFGLIYQGQKDIFYFYFKYTTFAMTVLQGVCLILSYVFTNFTFQRMISILNMCVFYIISKIIKIHITNFENLDYLILIIVYLTQQTYLQAWFITNSLDFYDGLFSYLSIGIISYGISTTMAPLALKYRAIIVTYNLMTGCFVSYFYVYEKKKSFYFNFVNESSSKSNSSIIQNMSSGYIRIKNYRIVSCNKILYSHLNKIENSIQENKNNINKLNENEINGVNGSIDAFNTLSDEHGNQLINELFNGIQIEPMNNSHASDNETDYERALKFVKNYHYDDIFQKANFIYIGNKALINENDRNSSHYFEIFGRHCDVFEQEKQDNFEFIFNDVSKTKINEEINTEIKYKTIFLSKIAHEFKNPLLCVSELIDQVDEELHLNSLDNSNSNNTNSNTKIKDKLKQIKSICEYLLILVKDLDFFSLKYTGSSNKIILEKHNLKLEGVINYCDSITNVLIKKYQKEENLLFSIDCKEELYQREIYTDEVRLKQLLINLLSNSVNNTNSGSITLQIKEENEDIVFSVIDTGSELTEEQQLMLTVNSIDNREIGPHSSGLGFSIIKQIIELFETKLYYGRRENHGSIFSFRLKLIPTIENSLSTLKLYGNNFDNSGTNESITVVENFSPTKSEIFDLREHLKRKPINDEEIDIRVLEEEDNTDYYLVVDDEKFTRKSTIRILNNYFTSLITNTRRKVILEASDGIECLYVFYQCTKKGIKLSFIVSDQTMNYMNGVQCAKILNDVIKSNKLRNIPFFIVTAYENFVYNKEWIYKSYSKPLNIHNIEEMFNLLTMFEN